MMRMAVMAVVMVVVVIVVQQPGADEIDAQTERGNGDRLLIVDGDETKEAQDRFIADAERDHAEDDGAGECRQFA